MQDTCLLDSSWILRYKGTTINDLGGGPEEIEKKKIFEALFQEKKILKFFTKAFRRKKKLYKGLPQDKIDSFSIFPRGRRPGSFVVAPLVGGSGARATPA